MLGIRTRKLFQLPKTFCRKRFCVLYSEYFGHVFY